MGGSGYPTAGPNSEKERLSSELRSPHMVLRQGLGGHFHLLHLHEDPPQVGCLKQLVVQACEKREARQRDRPVRKVLASPLNYC